METMDVIVSVAKKRNPLYYDPAVQRGIGLKNIKTQIKG